jgi:hypothetical protein
METNGPLQRLTPVFVDVETLLTSEITLKRMTLRQYLGKSHLISLAVAIGNTEPLYYETPNGSFKEQDKEVLSQLKALAENPGYVFVGHNAAFDMRVLRFLLGIPHPVNVWCSMEGAMAAWPELVGGYSLNNIAIMLGYPPELQKMEVDLETISKEQLELYNKQDVRVMQHIYYDEIPMIPKEEQAVGLRTQRQRKHHFLIDAEKLENLTVYMNKAASYAEELSREFLAEDEVRNIFNRDNEANELKSVRSLRLRSILQQKFHVTWDTTSLKKLSPVKQAQSPRATSILVQAGRANKMLSHLRRSQIFTGVEEVDLELGYFRAHTGRFSSPSTGRGLNLHNCPKHDKSVAKPIREMYKLPKELCFVRADLANVEYRVEGKLTHCKTVIDMFTPARGGDIFNDPYCQAWQSMTGQKIQKKDPIRQVAKAAVLGLGFCMGPTGFSRSLLTGIADTRSGITEEVLKKMGVDLHWSDPPEPDTDRIIRNIGCSYVIAKTAYYIHKKFNMAHPEFSRTADWLVDTIQDIAMFPDKDRARYTIEQHMECRSAPDPALIKLSLDEATSSNTSAFVRPSVRVQCGPWVPTVCWREPMMRSLFNGELKSDLRLTILKSTGQIKPFLRQLAIENITQAAARNMLCWGVGELDKCGFPDVIHIHDEILIIVRRDRESVLKARDALIKIFGPSSESPLGWATLIRPEEISVTESMWEDEDDINPGKGNRWARIEQNETNCLDNLP